MINPGVRNCVIIVADDDIRLPLSWLDAKETSLLSTSVILQLEVNECIKVEILQGHLLLLLLLFVVDDSFVGFFFNRLTGRLSLSL